MFCRSVLLTPRSANFGGRRCDALPVRHARASSNALLFACRVRHAAIRAFQASVLRPDFLPTGPLWVRRGTVKESSLVFWSGVHSIFKVFDGGRTRARTLDSNKGNPVMRRGISEAGDRESWPFFSEYRLFFDGLSPFVSPSHNNGRTCRQNPTDARRGPRNLDR
jgi:hypothetical protein